MIITEEEVVIEIEDILILTSLLNCNKNEKDADLPMNNVLIE